MQPFHHSTRVPHGVGHAITEAMVCRGRSGKGEEGWVAWGGVIVGKGDGWHGDKTLMVGMTFHMQIHGALRCCTPIPSFTHIKLRTMYMSVMHI